MPIPEDRQQEMLRDVQQRITQTRQQVQRAAHTIIQAQARAALAGSTSISEVSAAAYRYAYAVNSRNDGSSGDYFTGWMQNLIL